MNQFVGLLQKGNSTAEEDLLFSLGHKPPLGPPFSKGGIYMNFKPTRDYGRSTYSSRPLSLGCNPSSIYDEDMTIHKIRRLRGQENNRTEEVFQFTQALHGDAA